MSDAFSDHLGKFQDEQLKPWGKLRYQIALANLKRHFPPEPLRVLDAGGGNGIEAVALAIDGHTVTLVDPAAAMLAAAEAIATAHGVMGQLDFVQANLNDLQKQLPLESFDLVLCHNVIQYLERVDEALSNLLRMLVPGGLLSLISLNRYSETLRLAIQQMDLPAAQAALDTTELRTVTFDTPIHAYTSSEMAIMLRAMGVEILGEYGIRCVCDYIPDNARKFDPAFFAALEQLELALSDREPYRLLGRNFQIVARKRVEVIADV